MKDPKILEKAAAYLRHRGDRPILVGPFAVHLGAVTVEDAEELLLDLCDQGKVRLMSEADRARFGVPYGYLAV